jgi:hypothetical protein
MSLQGFLTSISSSFSRSPDPNVEQHGTTILRRLHELNETTTLEMPNPRFVAKANQDETLEKESR